jgi:hypothetical protein
MLATLTRAPSVFSPRRDLLRAQQRASLVLDSMMETGAITEAQAAEARAHPAVITNRATLASRNYFLDTAADEATKMATVNGVPPSARIETSPGNEQWWYFLKEPERDMGRFDGVIRAFIGSRLLGADPGMSGVTRVGRLPGFYNMKPAYGGWRVEMRELTDRRFTLDELLQRFSLQINGRRVNRDKLQTAEAIERNRAFAFVYSWLQERNMLKRTEPDRSGWTEMTCPWVGDHTGKADTGAALREPAPENEHYGAFRCHHGHCADKGWAELTEWVAEQSVEELDAAAKGA